MTLPNQLTCSRFVFALLLLICLSFSFPFAKTLALLLFALAAVTDYVDGKLARGSHGVTDFGKLMDPLADKVLVSVAFVCFVELRFDLAYPETPLAPAFLVVPILAREFMVTGLRLLAVEKGRVISAGPLGKWKTGLQMGTILFTLLCVVLVKDVFHEQESSMLISLEYTFHWMIWVFMAATTVVTIWSGVDYFQRNLDLFTSESNET